MSDPQGPRTPADDSGDVREDTAGFLAWVAGIRDPDFANELGAAIDGALTARPPLEWADAVTAATRIASHGGHARELTDDVRAWERRGGAGRARPRPVRQRKKRAPAAAWPPHCGECDPDTRQTLTEPPARCPACHPLTGATREDRAS